jgi:hypothetical protein
MQGQPGDFGRQRNRRGPHAVRPTPSSTPFPSRGDSASALWGPHGSVACGTAGEAPGDARFETLVAGEGFAYLFALWPPPPSVWRRYAVPGRGCRMPSLPYHTVALHFTWLVG